MERSIVLLSSGLDSTVNFYQAMTTTKVVMTLTFDYGQRAKKKEIEFAKKQSDLNDIPHKVVCMDFFKDFTTTSLVSQKMDVPLHVEINSLEKSQASAKSVWVPNRNGIFINIAAGFAEGLGAEILIVGFNKEEATTFPDNTQEYIDKVNESLEYSTLRKIKVKCFTTDLNKTEIVRLGKNLKVPFENIWACYFGHDKPCGQCESCLRFQRALTDGF